MPPGASRGITTWSDALARQRSNLRLALPHLGCNSHGLELFNHLSRLEKHDRYLEMGEILLMARGMAKLLYIVICIHIYIYDYIYICANKLNGFKAPNMAISEQRWGIALFMCSESLGIVFPDWNALISCALWLFTAKENGPFLHDLRWFIYYTYEKWCFHGFSVAIMGFPGCSAGNTPTFATVRPGEHVLRSHLSCRVPNAWPP
jgi:hypothetical protein